ncbi:lytic murein transglycosylase, partial [Moritella sp.]|uniref:lytic murein transglycosylase n=1 Tax=Moritella sp. TaxID=78556 RepID=UPI0025F987A4
YGKYKGNISVLDSLYTLGFNYPSRGKFFRQEFAQYIKLSEQQGWKLTETQGSYAGAMGLGQFISSSYSHYGVDFSGDVLPITLASINGLPVHPLLIQSKPTVKK